MQNLSSPSSCCRRKCIRSPHDQYPFNLMGKRHSEVEIFAFSSSFASTLSPDLPEGKLGFNPAKENFKINGIVSFALQILDVAEVTGLE